MNLEHITLNKRASRKSMAVVGFQLHVIPGASGSQQREVEGGCRGGEEKWGVGARGDRVPAEEDGEFWKLMVVMTAQ